MCYRCEETGPGCGADDWVPSLLLLYHLLARHLTSNDPGEILCQAPFLVDQIFPYFTVYRDQTHPLKGYFVKFLFWIYKHLQTVKIRFYPFRQCNGKLIEGSKL